MSGVSDPLTLFHEKIAGLFNFSDCGWSTEFTTGYTPGGED